MQQEARYMHPYLGMMPGSRHSCRGSEQVSRSQRATMQIGSSQSLSRAGSTLSERPKQLMRSLSAPTIPEASSPLGVAAGACRPFVLAHTPSQMFGSIVQPPDESACPSKTISVGNVGRILR
eukprot:TRINITY_DN56199_c0_g1_i1.p1 TRINITY_DN56199_c0_g1~~TRINITY_DN56199_c0_g1_i1.p1  ORF type:complete len:122 (+),score=5.28 TRINITY_DN56199_c0_g1_i1:58-423(+)